MQGGVWDQQRLTATDAAAGDYFGYSVSVSRHTAVVGSLRHDDAGGASGSAYVFEPEGGVTPDVPTLSFSMLALLGVALAGMGWLLSRSR